MPFPIKTCVICHEEFELRPISLASPIAAPPAASPNKQPSPNRAAPRLRERRAEFEVNAAAAAPCATSSTAKTVSLQLAQIVQARTA